MYSQVVFKHMKYQPHARTLYLLMKLAPRFISIKFHFCFRMCHLCQPTTLQNFTLWYGMVVSWLCWHRTILMKNIRHKQYSQFPSVRDFGKRWWGVAYVPCGTNLRAHCVWVIRWHVTDMLSLAETGTVDGHCPIMFVLTHSYPCDRGFVYSTLRDPAVNNLGQLLFAYQSCDPDAAMPFANNSYSTVILIVLVFYSYVSEI